MAAHREKIIKKNSKTSSMERARGSKQTVMARLSNWRAVLKKKKNKDELLMHTLVAKMFKMSVFDDPFLT